MGTARDDAIARTTTDRVKRFNELLDRLSSPTLASVSEFEAAGSTADGFDLGVRGHFNSRVGRGDGSVDVKMAVTVKGATKSENNSDCLLSVVLKMKEGKPIILGSAPVAGAQSFFVVQFIDAQ